VPVSAEFTIYPFIEGDALPPHVQAGIEAVRALGIDVEIGALSNTVRGEAEDVLRALHAAEGAAVAAGATRIVAIVETVE